MKSQLENLYRRSGITKENCFHAARRLNTHNSLSLWSLTMLAFSLIVISLLTQIYAGNSFVSTYERFLDFAMTALSILALIISLVVAKSNFALRADNFQKQAMEINELRISFKHLIDSSEKDSDKTSLYEKKSTDYANILKRNLVHDQIDFHVSSTAGIEHKYYFARLVLTEFTGYILVIFISIILLFWTSFNTYMHELPQKTEDAEIFVEDRVRK